MQRGIGEGWPARTEDDLRRYADIELFAQRRTNVDFGQNTQSLFGQRFARRGNGLLGPSPGSPGNSRGYPTDADWFRVLLDHGWTAVESRLCDDGGVNVHIAPLPEPSPPLLPGSVDDYLVTNVPMCPPDATASQVRAMLAGRQFESAADVAVCADGDGLPPRLLGLIPLESIMAAEAEMLTGDLMDPDPPVAAPGLHREKAAWKATAHGESSLAVVDTEGYFRGLVPPARFLAVLRAEHDEDLARLGGYLASSASARHAMYEPIATRLWHRLPWLVLGLIGSAGAAGLVDGFAKTLASDVRLAFFIPGIVYMADAVGTQTETLVIRGLSIGVPVRRVFGMESFTGLLVGLFLAALTIPTAWVVLGSLQIGFVLGLSLVGACSVATLVAMSLPWLMSRLGRDPAFGSGPLATVIQDVLSLLIYFLIATAILG